MTPIKVQDAKREEGFTLIELLVVVIIIGILAAIAIPTFLNQRERGWQAESTSAARNAALEIEAAATQTSGLYPLQTEGATLIVPFLARSADGGNLVGSYAVNTGRTAFRVCVEHPQIAGADNVTYLSASGGVQPFVKGTACATGAL